MVDGVQDGGLGEGGRGRLREGLGRRFVGGGEKLAVGWGAGMACCFCAVYNALGRGEQRKEMVRKQAFARCVSKLRQLDDVVPSTRSSNSTHSLESPPTYTPRTRFATLLTSLGFSSSTVC